MDAHQVEPVVLLCTRLKELNLAISECPKKSLVSDVAHAVQCKLSLALLEKDGLDDDVVGFRGAAIVVDKTGNLQQV